MMYHQPSSRRALFKGLLLVPATLLALGVFAHPLPEKPAALSADAASPAVSQPAPAVDAHTVAAIPLTITDAGPDNAITMLRELNKHLVYPESAKKAKIEGMVRAKLTIDKDGNLKGVVIDKSLTPDCDKAVVNAVKKFSKSTLKGVVENTKGAAKNNATITYILPVRFKLQ